MANNRLFIRDKKTGNTFMLAKFWGWGWTNYCEGLEDWLEEQQLEDDGPKITSNSMGFDHNYEIVNEDELLEREKDANIHV